MSTSANVIEYDIYNKDGEIVGHFRKHLLTKLPLYSDLLKYQPLSDHTILANGYDEEDEYWEEDEPENLEEFLSIMRICDSKLNEYFKPPIKVCPDCGEMPYEDRIAIVPTPRWVKCNCGRWGKSAFDADEAIENWNNDIIHEEDEDDYNQ